MDYFQNVPREANNEAHNLAKEAIMNNRSSDVRIQDPPLYLNEDFFFYKKILVTMKRLDQRKREDATYEYEKAHLKNIEIYHEI